MEKGRGLVLALLPEPEQWHLQIGKSAMKKALHL